MGEKIKSEYIVCLDCSERKYFLNGLFVEGNKKRFSVESASINTYTFFESHIGAEFLLLTDYINEYISSYWVHSCPVNWMRSWVLWVQKIINRQGITIQRQNGKSEGNRRRHDRRGQKKSS